MKKFCKSLLLITMMILLVAASTVSYGESYPSSWAEMEVNLAVNAGLVTESVKENYQSSITREQFCEMVVLAYEKISGETAQKGTAYFTDTDNEEILKAANLGIVSGYGGGIFAPDDLITREQIAAMLVRMIDKAIPAANVNAYNNNNFADKNDISNWALPSVNFAYDRGIMQGVGNNCIDPKANTSCEQAVLLIYRTTEKDLSSTINNDETGLLAYFTGGAGYIYYLPDDYDNDGSDEAFVITGNAGDWEGQYEHVSIYYISSNGNCELIVSDLYGYFAGKIDTGNDKFIVWEKNAGDPESLSYIYGCRNGQWHEPEISRQYESFRYGRDCFLGDKSDYSKGYHDWTSYEFVYNVNSKEFVLK